LSREGESSFDAMKTHAILVSWTSKHDNARAIANALGPAVDFLTIIYSDRDDGFELVSEFETIKVPNSWFFGKKFELALRKCEAEVLLYIDADVSCDDWPRLAERCRWAFRDREHTGVWTPLVDHTPHTLQRSRILTFPNSSLHAVCLTDSMTFAMPRATVGVELRSKHLWLGRQHRGGGHRVAAGLDPGLG
jgi:hypothetical protein